jgi:hypothetical protein
MVVCTADDEESQQNSRMKLITGGADNDDTADKIDESVSKYYKQHVLAQLEDKLTTIRLIDSHKPELRHCRNLVEEVVAIKENPLNEEQLTQLIIGILHAFDVDLPRRFSAALDITAMEWDEYVKRSGSQTLYLMIRRVIIRHGADRGNNTDDSGAWQKISAALAMASAQETSADVVAVLGQLSNLVMAYADTHTVLLSDHRWSAVREVYDKKTLTTSQASETSPFGQNGPWKTGIEKPVPNKGTHLDKIATQFIPPYLRDRINQDAVTQDAVLEKEIERVQDIDRAHERKKLTREMDHGELLAGFSLS